MPQTLTFGVTTFGDVAERPGEGRQSDADAVREVVDHAVAAERMGIDVFLIGEHHRPDMPLSAPDMVLASIAAQTEHIRLGTAVTVLSTDDPVRVYERFATLDALSRGRAEPILGRGSFTETFPLYGYDLAQYDELFEEKLNLWAALRAERETTWDGTLRPALHGQSVYPRTDHSSGIPTWVGVGGNPRSVLRVAEYGFNLMMAGLGMSVNRLAQYSALFTQAAEKLGVPRGRMGVNANGFIAETDREARDLLWPQYEARMNTIGRERGWSGIDRASFENTVDHGMEFVGSPETVAKRIAALVEVVGVDRVDFGFDTKDMPLEAKQRSLQLYAEVVRPMVHELTGTAPEREIA